MGIINEFDGLASVIANPPTDRPIAGAVGNFGRQVCDLYSSDPAFYISVIPLWGLDLLCGPYFDGAGISPPAKVPPFEGGQCPGVGYTPFIEVFNANTGAPNPNNPIQLNAMTGPISLETLNPPPVGCDPAETAQAAQRLVGADSVQQVRGAGCVLFATLGQITFQRIDGLPDDCGNPPPDLIPGPTPAPNPGPLPPGTGPQINLRGNPIFVLPPKFEFSPGLEVNFPDGEINLGSGTGNQPPQLPLAGEPIAGTGGADGGGAGGGGGGDNDFPPAPDGERWVGCCIDIVATPTGQGTILSSLPEPIYPNVIGNARLKFQAPNGPVIYDTPIAKRQQSTCLWEPTRGLAPVGCFVNLLPGFSYTLTPYSVPMEQ